MGYTEISQHVASDPGYVPVLNNLFKLSCGFCVPWFPLMWYTNLYYTTCLLNTMLNHVSFLES